MNDNSIVICSNSYKYQLLKNTNKLVNIKYYTLDEFIKLYYFDYDYKAILYLIKKYNVKYEIALEYLDNLIYIFESSYNNEKLDFLSKLKSELINNNLLIFNNKFREFIKNKDIIIYNYSLSKFDKYLLKDIKYEIINTKNNNYIPEVYEFNTVYDEITFVAHSISNLIYNGCNINDIKLVNVSDDYINIINKIFKFYNLKINKTHNVPIMSTIIGKMFYNNIDMGIENALNSIKEYSNTFIYNKIINILNKFVWCTDSDLKILLNYEFNNTYIDSIKYDNSIEVVDINNYDFNLEHVFLIGFNQGIIPNITKDEDYINDSIKPSYIDTTIEKNILEKNKVLKSIKNIKNLTITYKLKDSFNTYYKSSLIDELNVDIKKIENNYKISYSSLSDKLILSEMIDNLIKFNEKDKYLDILKSNYKIPYNTYSNSFSGLDKSKIKDLIKNKSSFNLSYSSMDNYYRCAFRFYIEKILNLKKNLDKFSITLGNIYHYVLDKAVKESIDVESTVYNFIKDNNIILTNSNKFFLNRAIDNIKYLIEVINKQMSLCSLNKIETEKEIKINIKDNIYFKGFIDKIIYDVVDNFTISAIIDYKTYVKKPSLNYIESGIGLQLPSYMYLANNSFNNIRFSGFYLQNILLDNKSDNEKEKSLKLIGYTNKDKTLLEMLDKNYSVNSYINGIKLNNDGNFSLSSLKNMLSDDEINYLIKLTENKINELIDNIFNCKFDINPKYDNGCIGCEFCEYRDLCYMRQYDYVNIKSNVFGDD